MPSIFSASLPLTKSQASAISGAICVLAANGYDVSKDGLPVETEEYSTSGGWAKDYEEHVAKINEVLLPVIAANEAKTSGPGPSKSSHPQ